MHATAKPTAKLGPFIFARLIAHKKSMQNWLSLVAKYEMQKRWVNLNIIQGRELKRWLSDGESNPDLPRTC